MLAGVDWKPTGMPNEPGEGDDIPYATHRGILKIGEFELRVFRLSNGMAIIQAEDLEKSFVGM